MMTVTDAAISKPTALLQAPQPDHLVGDWQQWVVRNYMSGNGTFLKRGESSDGSTQTITTNTQGQTTYSATLTGETSPRSVWTDQAMYDKRQADAAEAVELEARLATLAQWPSGLLSIAKGCKY